MVQNSGGFEINGGEPKRVPKYANLRKWRDFCSTSEIIFVKINRWGVSIRKGCPKFFRKLIRSGVGRSFETLE